MGFLLKILTLSTLDYLIIWCWMQGQDPDPSVSIFILVLVPSAIILNLVIAGLLAFFKKGYTVFLANAVVSALIMNSLFSAGITKHQNRLYESWRFIKADTTFEVTRMKETDEFSMSYSEHITNSASTTSFLDGICIISKNNLVLRTDSTKYIIRNNYLVGFRKPTDSIRIQKVTR